MKDGVVDATLVETIVDEARVVGYAISPQQRRAWRVGGGGAVAFASRALANRRVDAVVAMAAAAVRRHEILRTGFEVPAGAPEPLQVIHEHDRFELVHGDGDAADPAARAELAQRLHRPFDLASGQPLRLGVLAGSAGNLLVAVALPALCADGRSLELLLDELAGEGSGAETVQYADFADWQNGLVEESKGDPEGSLRRLIAILEVPPRLPLERVAASSPAVPYPATSRVVRWLSEEARAAVSRLAEDGLDAAAPVLLAVWQLLLRRLSGRSDLVPVIGDDGRPSAELDRALGAFAKFLPPSPAPSLAGPFGEHLAWARSELAQLHEVAHLYSAEVLEGRALPWGFTWLAAAASGGAGFSPAPAERFTVHLVCRAGDGGVQLALEHDSARVSAAEAELLLDRLETILRAADPARPAAQLPLLGELDRAHYRRLNDGAQRRSPAETLHGPVLERLSASPEAVALIGADGGAVTGGELVHRVERLAGHLQALGVRSGEDRVAVLLERSPDAVVALLAVLSAGGAFVPLDPDYPDRRLAAMLEDSAASLLVSTGDLLSRLPEERRPPHLVALDRDGDRIAAADSASPSPARTDGVAYVMYTSGSTGRPKGVVVPHRAIANRIRWMVDAFPFGAADRFLFKTPLSFDASLWELFVPLLSGARVVLAPPGGHRDPAALAAVVVEHGVTVLQLVPSLLRSFLDQPAVAACTTLRWMFCGGEALPVELARHLEEVLPAVRLHNLYGPTETAIDAASQPWDGSAPGWSVPIGRPLPHLSAWVVDGADELVPVGVTGELRVGGRGVARGYLGSPAVTAAAFVPDPFAAQPGRRLYRTGDQVRLLDDGRLEFLGRGDAQVKVRGARVEPGEVEGILGRHPRVREVAVVARPLGADGDLSLVAYAVPDQVEAVDETALRAWMEERLPPHLVPSRTVVLPQLPRTPSGKVDRKALPDPPVTAGAGAGPRTPMEELVAGVWAEILGVDRVGSEDDFFALGGHSLLATRVASRLREAVGVEVPLRILLTETTLRAQARAVAQARSGAGSGPPPLEAAARGGTAPLSFAQQRLWFLDRMDSGSHAFNLPVAVRMEGELDVEAVHRAFAAIQERHEILRTVYREEDGRPAQVVQPPGDLDFAFHDLSAAPEPEAELRPLLHAEVVRPFDLEAGPLQRIRLFRLGPQEHAALLVTHHIACDAWSMGILVRELGALYAAQVRGERPDLPELPVQYADYATWQRSWLSGETLKEQEGYWRRSLEGAPPLLELPADRPRPDVPSGRGRQLAHVLPASLGDDLRALARQRGITLFMLSMAAFQVLLFARTGRRDLVVGTDIANRNHLETEPLVGFFINQLALRVRLAPEDTFADLLRQVREVAFGAYAHQDLPFDKVVEILRPERSLRHAPIFQVKLNLQNVPPEALTVADVTVSPLDLQPGASQLDLLLNLVDGRETLFGTAHFNVDLFDEPTIADLWADFEAVLASVVARPEIPLDELVAGVEAATQERQQQRRSRAQSTGMEKLKRLRRRPATRD